MKMALILGLVVVLGSCNTKMNQEITKTERDPFKEKEAYMVIYNQYSEGTGNELIPQLQEYTKTFSQNYNGWTFLGVIQTKTGDYKGAKRNLEKALELKPESKNALTALGVVYRTLGEYNKAESLYLKSLEIDPNFAEAYSSLVIIELLKNDFPRALDYGMKAIHLDSTNPVILGNVAVAEHYLTNYSERDRLIEEARKYNHDDIEALELLFNSKLTIEELFKTNHNNK